MMRRNITPRQINITHRKNNSNSTPKQNNTNNNTTNLHSNQATIISKIHNELRKLENLEEILSTTANSFDRSLSILDLCTLCTKVSNTYNISDKTRAEKFIQILYSIEAYIKYLNIEKLTSILNRVGNGCLELATQNLQKLSISNVRLASLGAKRVFILRSRNLFLIDHILSAAGENFYIFTRKSAQNSIK